MQIIKILKSNFVTSFLTLFFLLGIQTTSFSQNEFITTWQTSTNNQQVTIPIFSGETYDYTVDWGDGVIETNITGDATHVYATTIVYTVKISGTFPRIYFNNNSFSKYIKSIEHWGTNSWTSMRKAFYGCSNILNNANDVPDLSGVTDMSYMFSNASRLGTNFVNKATNWGSWNTSTITKMNSLFSYTDKFNEDIGSWDTSNVTDMTAMFASALIFNQDISTWNTSKVTNMNFMFNTAILFNQNIGNWNTSNVIDMNYMFYRARNFNGTIDSWNTSSVTDMRFMFSETRDFNQSLNSWNTSAVTNMRFMFSGNGLFNKEIGSWDTSAVKLMEGMFSSAASFNQNIDTWNTGAVTNMVDMFSEARAFNQSLNSWNTASVTDMKNMFYKAQSFNQSIGNWDTSNVTSMKWMFKNAPFFNQDISAWNTSSVSTFEEMFFEAFKFNQDISTWDTSNCYYMNSMFNGAMVFNQNISAWKTSKVRNMFSMFIGALAFDQNLGNWDITSVTNMTNMFNGATLSSDNYDALLIGWSAQNLKSSVTFNAGNSKYCSENAQNARKNIISTYGWTIHDLGLFTGCTTASLNEYNLDKSILVYPNSVKEILTIKSNNLLQKITLRDINGRSILEKRIDNQQEKSISLSKITTGIYFAKIVSNKGQSIKKIIKK